MTDRRPVVGEERSPVFVVGVARSGTTLLAAMLSAHSRLDCGPESRFFARLRHLDPGALARITDARHWPAPAVDFLASLENQGHPVVALFGLTIDEVREWLGAREPSLQAVLEALVVQHAERRGKVRWVEKTPRHLLAIASLRRLWPDAAIVRIVRDPRDVALSLAAMPFAGDSLVGNLVRIDEDDRASRDLIARDRRAFSLRYEDLVSDPEAELRGLCAFLGEAFEPAMLDPGASAPEVAGEHEWWKHGVSGPLDPSRRERWRTGMPEDVRRFAGLHLSAYLDEHRYPGARVPADRIATIPVGAALGPRLEGLLLGLAADDLVVERPPPERLAALRRQEALVFVGVRGQLDPFRARSPLRRAASLLGLGILLAVRRGRGRPALWVRRSTGRARRPRDPGELLVAALLRVLARQARHQRVPALIDGSLRRA